MLNAMCDMSVEPSISIRVIAALITGVGKLVRIFGGYEPTQIKHRSGEEKVVEYFDHLDWTIDIRRILSFDESR
ncbi:hypothetical protein NW755_014295 [Fusarium falciforme]|uniref:Uncharacterized protein n=1 Tax=Fusarium falciforme TaxID=195108 RepID=A0A9W8UUY1_9HYPO|nr:hypothetical protein NW755_014295 [Fusarium falciforme]